MIVKRWMRSIRKRWRYLTDARIITLDGLRIISDKALLPEELRDLIYREAYEHSERSLLIRVLKPGMRTLEIGAGVGFISMLAHKLSGPGNVRSYEANPKLEKTIRENFRLNGMVPDLRMKAVTTDGQPVTFFRNDNIISSSLYDRKLEAEKIVVQSEAFNSVVAEFNPDVLVMDVEGAEVEIFATAKLDSIRHIIVELHPHIVGEEKIAGVISGLEASGFRVRERDRKTFHFERAKY